jgi:SAM-dependent methyltransferase
VAGEPGGARVPRVAARYDTIGADYASRRREEPAWAHAINEALDDARCVLNVGAGSGNYEPCDRVVVAVEPSETMLAQRPDGAAPAVRACAEALPFADHAFDAALAVLTVHHWRDPLGGLKELARVAERQVLVSWDLDATSAYWLCRDYLPEIAELAATLSTVDDVVAVLDVRDVRVLPVPRDCADGVMGAHWSDPEAYLDPTSRGAMSGLALLDPDVVEVAMARLADDLADGTWLARNEQLAELDELDAGFRLVVAGGATPRG